MKCADSPTKTGFSRKGLTFSCYFKKQFSILKGFEVDIIIVIPCNLCSNLSGSNCPGIIGTDLIEPMKYPNKHEATYGRAS